MSGVGIISCMLMLLTAPAVALVLHALKARRSGWTRLHRRYPGGGVRGGRLFDHATFTLNGSEYRSTAGVALGGGGVRLCGDAVFRAFHGPVLIPWDDVTSIDRSPDATSGMRLHLVAGESAVLTLTGPVARAAEQFARRQRDRASR